MAQGASKFLGRTLIFSLKILILVLCYSTSSCGRPARESLSKDQALKEVKVSTINGWQEAISDQGHFRVLFPGAPTMVENGDGAGLRGFKLITPDKNWFSYWKDFTDMTPHTEPQLRDAYRQSTQAIAARAGAKVLSQSDVRLNGRLGSEVVIENPSAVSYMRVFQIGQRNYILAVDVKKTGETNAAIPGDVQQFFDSFTFWQ